MQLPKVGLSYAQERLGINALQSYAASHSQIWRETTTGDVGIDGNLEFVNSDGFATGKVIAVQVKSGPSYFKSKSEHGWKFYPEEKHRAYWEAFPLPVILVLHDPLSRESYWADVRQVLRTPTRTEEAFLDVPQWNLLETTAPTRLFATAGVQAAPFIDGLEDVLKTLINTCSRDAGFPLSYFDLFTHGLTNLCRSVYYGMDLVCNAVEYNLYSQKSEFGMGVGDVEQNFVFDYVRFLLAQGLAQIDFADCLIDWEARQMQPHFVAPLTARGRALVKLIRQKEAALASAGKIPDDGDLYVARDGYFGMQLESYFMKFPYIKRFQDASMLSDTNDETSHP